MANEEMAKAPAQAVEQVAEKGLLDQIVDDGRVGTDVATRERGKSLVKEFISQVLEGEVTVSKDVEAMINARVAQIDHLLSIQLNEVLHHPQFQKLEVKLARFEVPHQPKRDQHHAEDSRYECLEERASARSAAGL